MNSIPSSRFNASTILDTNCRSLPAHETNNLVVGLSELAAFATIYPFASR